MKITIEHTNKRTQFRDREYSVWRGTTAKGLPIEVLIHSFRCPDPESVRDFQNECRRTVQLRELSCVNTVDLTAVATEFQSVDALE